MFDLALVMAFTLAVLLFVAAFGLRGSWRIVWRMAVLGVAIICIELTLIQAAPIVGRWAMEVAK
ncbi:hypothetical protein OOK58_42185 [Streptomyces sp. NBC_01728]|uniref:hypothetical protein n=1 Tax=Streptomyces TaxID=1883 RepID=UPI00225A7FCA|nr:MULTISPECIES: hypothetical protein [Streptomyces]MCX4458525.1 hypothetical protein [Streptomyces sp. NBC_01719]MCX4497882.1 hypothetical protein [Streptomyces sp. NBC_01728]MCX4609460.1 hypothetical protein [Streptomyces mirabilis]